MKYLQVSRAFAVHGLTMCSDRDHECTSDQVSRWNLQERRQGSRDLKTIYKRQKKTPIPPVTYQYAESNVVTFQ